MAEIFGLDIQAIVSEAINAAGGLTVGVLVKTVEGARDSTRPTLKAAPTTTRHQLQAAVETKQVRRDNTAVAETVFVATIIGGSISPPAVPVVGDLLELADITYKLSQLRSADPAQAVYEFQVS